MIRGYFDRIGYERPVARLEIDCSLPMVSPIAETIDFLIDTGSISTTLHPRDMIRSFHLTRGELAAPERWNRSRTGIGIGGRVMEFIEAAQLRLRRDDGTLRTFEHDVLIAQLTSENEYLPSLLGWDVLRHFRLTLDTRTGVVLLEE